MTNFRQSFPLYYLVLYDLNVLMWCHLSFVKNVCRNKMWRFYGFTEFSVAFSGTWHYSWTFSKHNNISKWQYLSRMQCWTFDIKSVICQRKIALHNSFSEYFTHHGSRKGICCIWIEAFLVSQNRCRGSCWWSYLHCDEYRSGWQHTYPSTFLGTKWAQKNRMAPFFLINIKTYHWWVHFRAAYPCYSMCAASRCLTGDTDIFVPKQQNAKGIHMFSVIFTLL